MLWRSPRLGFGGRRFDLLSFRTMRDDPGGDVQTRLTRTGRVLRNYSLDHLPTLLNVLRGDMSVVGPRPNRTGSTCTTHAGNACCRRAPA